MFSSYLSRDCEVVVRMCGLTAALSREKSLDVRFHEARAVRTSSAIRSADRDGAES